MKVVEAAVEAAEGAAAVEAAEAASA